MTGAPREYGRGGEAKGVVDCVHMQDALPLTMPGSKTSLPRREAMGAYLTLSTRQISTLEAPS
jgi:hypothetical protein